MFAILLIILTVAGAVAGAGGGGGGGGGAAASSGGGGTGGGDSGGGGGGITTKTADDYRTSEYRAQWGLEAIHAAEAYAYLYNNGKITDAHGAGYGVKVGVVDTGAQIDHPELVSQIDLVNSYNYYNSSTDINDVHGHGTHVGSTIAGNKDDSGMHGVAYDSSLIVADVHSGGSSLSGTNLAISGVADDGAKVINGSFGGSYSYGDLVALDNAKSKDVAVALATGNEYAANPAYPAAFAQSWGLDGYIIAVGAAMRISGSSTDISNIGVPTFSNECGDVKNYCLVAPGVSIYAALPTNSYASWNGTSMATPHVAGALAVLRSAWPSLTAPQAIELLLTNATDISMYGAGVDDVSGHGLLNLYAAVQAHGVTSIVGGSQVNSAGYNLTNSQISFDPIFGDSVAKNMAQALKNAVFFDDYGRDYRANLQNKISTRSTQSIAYNLNGMMLNNYKTNVIPFSFNLKNRAQGFVSVASQDFDKSELQAKVQFKSYSDNRSKYLIVDRAIEDKALTMGNGFAFVQENGRENKVGFSYNIDEARNLNFKNFNNAGFISINGFGTNPYQSFVNGVGKIYSDTQNNLTQRNFNQFFVSQKILDTKFNLNFSLQTSYDNSSILAKTHNKQNQISDLNFSYKPNESTNIAVSFGNLTEFNNNFLNSQSSGAFTAASNSKTSYVKFAASKKLFGDVSLISTFSEGLTKASGNDLGIFRGFNDVRSRSAAVGIVNENAFGGRIGVLYSEPLRVYKGSATINIPVARDIAGNVTRYVDNVSLVPNGRERDLEFFYSRQINSDAMMNFNFVTIKDAGNIKKKNEDYLGMMHYNLRF